MYPIDMTMICSNVNMYCQYMFQELIIITKKKKTKQSVKVKDDKSKKLSMFISLLNIEKCTFER